ncbi:MAG: hypothetical protein RI554_08020 [Trueperaceae bacterium]|nr:hypothetical protein [Trueperaceae bacterium]
MKTSVAIYTHATRTASLERTLQSVRDANLRVDVVTTQARGASNALNRTNAVAALSQAFNGNAVLMLEDDVLLSPYARAWIEHLETHVRDVTTLYAPVGKFYPTTVREFVDFRKPVPRHLHGVHPLERLRGWYGAQAVWIPAPWVESILATPDFRREERDPLGPWDHALRKHLLQHDAGMRVVVPNVVQHQAPPSVVNRSGPRHTTPIFDAAAKPPERNHHASRS